MQGEGQSDSGAATGDIVDRRRGDFAEKTCGRAEDSGGWAIRGGGSWTGLAKQRCKQSSCSRMHGREAREIRPGHWDLSIYISR